MSVNLTKLVERLQREVAPRGGKPNDSDYRACVESAVADFSARVPLKRHTTIDVVSGTDTYSLPNDFRKVIRIEEWDTSQEISITSAGIIPLSKDFREEHYTLGTDIIFVPEPTYDWDARELWYEAVHLLDANDNYPYMMPEHVNCLILKAQALAQGIVLNEWASMDALYATAEGVRQDMVTPIAALDRRIKQLEKDYASRIAELQGRLGLWADYTYAEAEAGGLTF